MGRGFSKQCHNGSLVVTQHPLDRYGIVEHVEGQENGSLPEASRKVVASNFDFGLFRVRPLSISSSWPKSNWPKSSILSRNGSDLPLNLEVPPPGGSGV